MDVLNWKPTANIKALSFSQWIKDWCDRNNTTLKDFEINKYNCQDKFERDTDKIWGDFFGSTFSKLNGGNSDS